MGILEMVVLRRVLIWLRNLIIGLFVFSLLWVFAAKFIPVYYTPLMFIRVGEQFKEGKELKLKHKWVPISEIAQPMIQAVVASEDNLFMEHNGFDLKQIQEAREEAIRGERVRGASTITQQTAKNVFLWPGRSYIRKGLEAYFTVLIEWVWGKERIMEVYLNSIEMGDGIYGVEAVAQENFDKPASQLNKRQAALIAATLPNPRKFSSAKPSPYMRKRQSRILSVMGKMMKIKMGYSPESSDLDVTNIKKRKKWRAFVTPTLEGSTMQMH